ncbi:MAG: molybdopterin-guanine dinucleotide biosynthesis protein MobB [Desulfovibrionales bacterium]
MLKAISIIGYKNSGKTTLAASLARELKNRGQNCTAVKFSRHGFDKADTDTARLAAYAEPVIGISPEESAVYWQKDMRLADLSYLAKDNFLIVEGGKEQTTLPRIILAENENQALKLDNGLALAIWGHCSTKNLKAIRDISRLADLVLEKSFLLPGLDCGTCNRQDCLHLAREIVAGKAAPAECAASHPVTNIEINGSQLNMNGFLNNMITNAILGMLSPLKGYAPGEINIKIKN